MSDDLVSTTLNNWLENNPDNSELVASIDISNKKYQIPNLKFQIPSLKSQTPNLRSQISNLEAQI